jgi:hypothetical protein
VDPVRLIGIVTSLLALAVFTVGCADKPADSNSLPPRLVLPAIEDAVDLDLHPSPEIDSPSLWNVEATYASPPASRSVVVLIFDSARATKQLTVRRFAELAPTAVLVRIANVIVLYSGEDVEERQSTIRAALGRVQRQK